MPREGIWTPLQVGLLPDAEEVLADLEPAGDLATDNFWSVIIFTEASLNSAVYVERGRAISGLLGLSLHR